MLHQILRVTGALYLVFLAWKLSASALGEARETRPLNFIQAAMFQAVNPKSWVKSITLASVFMPVGLSTPVGALLVATGGLVVGFSTAYMRALFGVAVSFLLHPPVFCLVCNAPIALADQIELRLLDLICRACFTSRPGCTTPPAGAAQRPICTRCSCWPSNADS